MNGWDDLATFSPLVQFQLRPSGISHDAPLPDARDCPGRARRVQAHSAKPQDPDRIEPQDVTLQTWCESINGSWLNMMCTVSGAATLAFGYRLIIEIRETVIITGTGTFTNEGQTNILGGILNDGLMILSSNLLSQGEFENNGSLNIVRAMTNRDQQGHDQSPVIWSKGLLERGDFAKVPPRRR